MDAVRRLARPELRKPVAILSFEGWNDASDAASGAVSYLIGQYDAEPFLIIDPEEFIDFQQTRPTVTVEDGIRTDVMWPSTRFYAIPMPDRSHDVIAVLGDEPNLRWQSFSALIADLLLQESVTRAILLGAFLGQVPHTRPVPLVATSSDGAELENMNLGGANYSGPTGIVGVLAHTLRADGLDTMSLWAAVPHYLGTNPNPKAMMALLQKTAEILDLSVDATELSKMAGDFESRVDLAMSSSGEFSSYIQRLEESLEDRDPSVMEAGDAEQLISEVEDFLREN